MSIYYIGCVKNIDTDKPSIMDSYFLCLRMRTLVKQIYGHISAEKRRFRFPNYITAYVPVHLFI